MSQTRQLIGTFRDPAKEFSVSRVPDSHTYCIYRGDLRVAEFTLDGTARFHEIYVGKTSKWKTGFITAAIALVNETKAPSNE